MYGRCMKLRKVLVGPFEVAGYYANLAKGLKAIGVKCDYVTYGSHVFGYGGETRAPAVLKLMSFFFRCQAKFSQYAMIRRVFTALVEVCQWFWFAQALASYDCFIFGFGQSLLRGNRDLPILKYFGKRIIVNIGHGSDARPPYMDGSYQTAEGAPIYSLKVLRELTFARLDRVRRLEKYSDVVVGAPFSTSVFASQPYVNFLYVGLPFSSAEDCAVSSTDLVDPVDLNGQRIRILHSPSHPAVKGSKLIVQAIERLKAKGHQIDLILLQGRPHAEVIQEIKKCDFVVDQAFSDMPMSGFATEAAWFGKAAVVGGYGFDELKKWLASEDWPPSFLSHPDELENSIEALIVDRQARIELGRAAQRFVREKWNAAKVAKRYLQMIEGEVPSQWFVNPSSIGYLYGCGFAEDKLLAQIRQLIDAEGAGALCLDHRPELLGALLSLTGQKAGVP